jgi:tripeptide aminopeptidase
MQQPDSDAVSAVRATVSGTAAIAHSRRDDAQVVADMRTITAIAAPTGSEAERGRWVAERLRAAGIEPLEDGVGNIIAPAPAAEPSLPRVVVAAHLDTVFAADTDLSITDDGGRILAPGISDNSRGLAAMLALVRALAAAGWPLRAPVVFMATVGEEGVGDLRGAKYYMEQNAARTGAFIALDGAGASRVIHTAVGSRRLRAVFRGSGGHSWSDWGAPNALHAAARAIAACTALPLPSSPRTTLTVARIGGGTSINSIPADTWLELDLRSEQRGALIELEARVRSILQQAAAEEGPGMECDVTVFGDRPAGTTPRAHPLVRLAEDATRAIGLEPELAGSSTDANVAMSLGIPAIAIGAGGDAGCMHTTAEWYDNTGGSIGLERALLIVMAAAGVAGE